MMLLPNSMPSGWALGSLGEFSSISDGDWIESKDQEGNNYRLLQVSNIGVGNFRETGNFRYITQATFDRLRCKEVLPGQILVSRMPEPVGRAWLVTHRPWKAITAVDVAIVEVDGSRLDAKFCTFYLNSPVNLAYAQARASGTTRLRITRRDLETFPVPLPPLPTQQKIAAVLSAYDDLIENNTRRIKILEDMAQMLYREWFVHFRFPEHEKSKMVETAQGLIPEGWESRRLGDVAHELRRGIDINKVDPETPYVGLEHIPRRSIALHEWGKAKDVQSTKLMFDKEDILFGKIRPYFHKVSVAPIAGICSSDIIVIKAKRPEHYAMALCCVSSDDFILEATQTSQGTKMPRANWGVLTKFPVAIPPEHLLAKFNDFALNSVKSVENLAIRNRNLRQTRDLLLPKLISGEVDVAELDIVGLQKE